MAVLAKSYIQRPSLKPDDFLIDQRANEARYVPTSLVPTEVLGDVKLGKLDLYLRYITSENASLKKIRLKNVVLEVGKFTQKILVISVTFEPSYENLLECFDDAAKSVRKARASLAKRSIQKSYELIAEFLEIAKNDFKKPTIRQDMEKLFLNANQQKRLD